MRYILENTDANKLPAEMRKRGILPRQRLRVVVETLDDDIPLARAAEQGGAFAFLADEPDLYIEADLKKSNG